MIEKNSLKVGDRFLYRRDSNPEVNEAEVLEISPNGSHIKVSKEKWERVDSITLVEKLAGKSRAAAKEKVKAKLTKLTEAAAADTAEKLKS